MSEAVRNYYDKDVTKEWERLASPYRRLELVSTLRLIDEFFPPGCQIADIGGGPGRYTVELLKRGYLVSLFDLSPRAIEFARSNLKELNLHAEQVEVADARDLAFLPSQMFDAALNLGPMYHIVEEDDRLQALSELHRILKPGAPAIVGFINPWGLLRSGLSEFPQLYADEPLIRQLFATFVQSDDETAFTESAFIPPPQAMGELRSCGFAVECRAGVEGCASGALEQTAALAESDPAGYDVLCRLVVESSTHPAFRDCTEHLHVVVRKIA
ncbi:class I SAM-dependent methyltransferase [Candidatus Bipolaricaulota bacterium]